MAIFNIVNIVNIDKVVVKIAVKIVVNIFVNIVVKVVKIASPSASIVSMFDILFVKTLTWIVALVHKYTQI